MMLSITYVAMAEWEVIGRIPDADGDVVWLLSPKTGALREAAEVDAGEGNFAFINDTSFVKGLTRDQAISRVPAEYRVAA